MFLICYAFIEGLSPTWQLSGEGEQFDHVSVAHIGHLYTAVLTDAVSRWYRVLRVPVVFSTGTDKLRLKVCITPPISLL